jgi:hypothetical protein
VSVFKNSKTFCSLKNVVVRKEAFNLVVVRKFLFMLLQSKAEVIL